MYKRQHQNAIIPETPGTTGAIGLDLAIPETVILPPDSINKIPLGLYCKIPNHLYGIIYARSGWTMNSVRCETAILDPDFRGQLHFMIRNLSKEPQKIPEKARLGQLIIYRTVTPFVLEEKEETQPQPIRGSGGFGSTGL